MKGHDVTNKISTVGGEFWTLGLWIGSSAKEIRVSSPNGNSRAQRVKPKSTRNPPWQAVETQFFKELSKRLTRPQGWLSRTWIDIKGGLPWPNDTSTIDPFHLTPPLSLSAAYLPWSIGHVRKDGSLALPVTTIWHDFISCPTFRSQVRLSEVEDLFETISPSSYFIPQGYQWLPWEGLQPQRAPLVILDEVNLYL